MLKRNTRTHNLRDELSKALRSGRFSDALATYELIEKRKPSEPRWPHRKGELLLRMGRRTDAVAAYERAIDLYAAKGFNKRAIATAKVMLAIDPTKADVLQRLDNAKTEAFHHPLVSGADGRLHPR